MSPSTATRTWGRATPVRSGSKRVLLALLLAGVAVALVLLGRSLQPPSKAPPLTVDNQSAYAVTIDASGAGTDGWVTISQVDAHSTIESREIVDQGAVWTLRFTAQGRSFNDYTVTRQELADNGWHYTVPADIGTQLGDAGVPESP